MSAMNISDMNISLPSVALEGRVQELESELRKARALHRSELETLNSRLKDGMLYHMTHEAFSW